jgi:hypothetical protein
VARLFRDQREQEKLQVVACEFAAGAEAAAVEAAIAHVGKDVAEAAAMAVLAAMAHLAGHVMAEVVEDSMHMVH